MDSQQCLPDRQVAHVAKLNRPHGYLQKPLAADRRPRLCTFGRTASEQAGSLRPRADRLFLLHEAQIADDGEQPLSDGCFGSARQIEQRIKVHFRADSSAIKFFLEFSVCASWSREG
jgi:hypothetical protein